MKLSPNASRILVAVRQSMRLTRAQAANALKINEHTLRSLERNPHAAKVSMMLKVLAFYNVNLKELC